MKGLFGKLFKWFIGRERIDEEPEPSGPALKLESPLGLLFNWEDNNGWRLGYFNVKTKEVSVLGNEYCYKILADDVLGDVFLSSGDTVKSLFAGYKKSQEDIINDLHSFRGRVINCGWHGLADTLEEKVLIPKEQLQARGFRSITSLATDQNNQLYGLCWRQKLSDGRETGTGHVLDYANSHHLVRIAEEKEEFSLGQELLSVNVGSRAELVIVPPFGYRDEKLEYGFHFIITGPRSIVVDGTFFHPFFRQLVVPWKNYKSKLVLSGIGNSYPYNKVIIGALDLNKLDPDAGWIRYFYSDNHDNYDTLITLASEYCPTTDFEPVRDLELHQKICQYQQKESKEKGLVPP